MDDKELEHFKQSQNTQMRMVYEKLEQVERTAVESDDRSKEAEERASEAIKHSDHVVRKMMAIYNATCKRLDKLDTIPRLEAQLEVLSGMVAIINDVRQRQEKTNERVIVLEGKTAELVKDVDAVGAIARSNRELARHAVDDVKGAKKWNTLTGAAIGAGGAALTAGAWALLRRLMEGAQ